jgi:hypothetical protein
MFIPSEAGVCKLLSRGTAIFYVRPTCSFLDCILNYSLGVGIFGRQECLPYHELFFRILYCVIFNFTIPQFINSAIFYACPTCTIFDCILNYLLVGECLAGKPQRGKNVRPTMINLLLHSQLLIYFIKILQSAILQR